MPIRLPPEENTSYCQVYPGLNEFGREYSSIHSYLALGICLLGILTNALNAVVLTHSRMRSPTNLILTSIAIADSITMFGYGGRDIYYHFVTGPDPLLYQHGQAGIYFLLVTNFTTIAAHIFSTIMTVMLAAFRCWVLYRPQYQVPYTHINVTIIIASLLSAVMFVMCFATERVGQLEFPNPAEQPKEGEYYWFEVKEGFDKLERANFIIYGCFLKLASSILITLFTALILVAMEKARRRYLNLKQGTRKQDGGGRGTNDCIDGTGGAEQQYLVQKKRETRGNHRTTVMLVAVVVSFVITEAPQGVIITITAVKDACFTYTVYAQIGDLLDILVLFNASTNFILYCAMSAQFRKSFKELILQGLLYRICWRKSHSKDGGPSDRKELRKDKQPEETVLLQNI